MGSISASWTENQAVSLDDSTPGAGAEAKGAIDLAANGYVAVLVQFEVTFGGSPDGAAECRVRASADSGGDVDTEPLYAVEVAAAATTTKRLSVLVENVPYLEVAVLNGDSTDDITAAVTYAGMKYATA